MQVPQKPKWKKSPFIIISIKLSSVYFSWNLWWLIFMFSVEWPPELQLIRREFFKKIAIYLQRVLRFRCVCNNWIDIILWMSGGFNLYLTTVKWVILLTRYSLRDFLKEENFKSHNIYRKISQSMQSALRKSL